MNNIKYYPWSVIIVTPPAQFKIGTSDPRVGGYLVFYNVHYAL
jgi:hypothetical protein